MDDAPPPLPDEALAAFGLNLDRFLGGRVRKHWLVRRNDEPFVLTRYPESEASLLYERRVLEEAVGAGWPVPTFCEGPISANSYRWAFGRWLPGEPPTGDDEPMRRGRLLAEFHTCLERRQVGERPGFRRAEQVLVDPEVERTVQMAEVKFPEAARLVRWHLEQARMRSETIDFGALPSQIIHGDFTPWNLRFQGDRLTGLLDFELAREDYRIADFAMAWRGKYDAVIHGYEAVTRLEPQEWAALTPIWWLGLIDGWCATFRREGQPDEWTMAKLRLRSPLMGPDCDAEPR